MSVQRQSKMCNGNYFNKMVTANVALQIDHGDAIIQPTVIEKS
jgi:hypothetical protein